ncbi:hypothetical protein [Demequina sp.]|uniref:hypothetical protein n=1 Tax=Demequina sp. TaxID=2050685 RepID=UPI003D12C74D
MVPAALLAIVGLGLVLAFVIPQRIKERSDYALVRTEDRYSAQMRVVKASARRVETAHSRPSSDSGEVPLLVTGAARAQIAALGEERMSRPAGPLERAAVSAQREAIALRGDRAAVIADRKATARRRARVASIAGFVAVTGWVLAAVTPFPAVLAAVLTALFGGVLVAGARAASAQRAADAHLHLVAREVEAAATATQALRRVAAERAAGVDAEPSDLETQAIRVVTAADLAPLAVPAPIPSPVLPSVEEPPHTSATPAVHPAWQDDDANWAPRELPAPAYTLKPAVRPQSARPLDESDYAGASYAVSAPARAERPAELVEEVTAASDNLDAILARRRRATA